ncbi:DUF4916 domain-containing protein [Paenibacillus sp. NFR01]|uniref:DUF4916 domain-containing protein n=1 Tax=Paenibacillus sp. NFR01 TaxID=1566279 RepID=UPI001587885E|nr:DUF4916 domain-containing protein [Paenibacillus sp. NFR01]
MNWIGEEDWLKIQRWIPIVCVDILPIIASDQHEVQKAGLILRKTPHEGEKWCTVGGRLFYGEPIRQGVLRQLSETLGEEIQVNELGSQPLYVAQYAPSLEVQEGFDAIDPRKHAIGLTYSVELTGEISPQNEALDFRYFTVQELVDKQDIGFEQKAVILACLERLNVNWGTKSHHKYF